MDERTQASIAAYDSSAAAYQEAWQERRPRDAARKLAALAGRGALVLDVASGPSLDVRLLRDVGLRVTSGDRSMECMRIGHTFFPKGLLARWDLRRLPFADATFRGIWAPAALHHLPRKEIVPALRELRRVHAAGPIFLSFREGHAELEPFEDPPAGTVWTTSLSAEELKALLGGAGYQRVEVEARPDPLGRPTTWLYGWGRLAG